MRMNRQTPFSEPRGEDGKNTDCPGDGSRQRDLMAKKKLLGRRGQDLRVLCSSEERQLMGTRTLKGQRRLAVRAGKIVLYPSSPPFSNRQVGNVPFCPLRTNFLSATGNICISCIEKEKLRATDVCCDIYLHGGRGRTHQ